MQRAAKNVVPLVSVKPVQRRRKAAEWKRLVEEWRASGESAEAYGVRADVRAKTLEWWSAELARRGRVKSPAPVPPPPAVTFLPVSVRGADSIDRATSVFARVEVGGFTVQVLSNANMALVAELCRVLAGHVSC
jgi:hypothetical protein